VAKVAGGGTIVIEDIRGKGALVTGASTGIGAAAALALGRLGARVAVHFNRSATEAEATAQAIRSAGGIAVLVQGNLAAAEAGAEVVREAADGLGRLDILVNNAGAILRRQAFREMDFALYQAALDLNVRSVIAVSQAAIPHLEKQGGGAIVNVGSIAGSNGGGPGSAHYACAKAYIHNLTRHMATELAPRGIRVNAIAPGVIATPFHAETPPERMEAMRGAVAMGRLGESEDCAGPIVFLVSAMSGYVTGQILHVNGGQYMP
jgi:3-oxoacyl-[acyl-carrier protein] reductase